MRAKTPIIYSVRRRAEIESMLHIMKEQNTEDVGKMERSYMDLFGFHFARRGRERRRELTTQTFEINTDDTEARYVAEKLTEQAKLKLPRRR